MKKKLLSATALSFALTASAFAADLPSLKAPVYVPPPPPAAWTGFYVGLNVGGTWAGDTSDYVNAAPGGCSAAFAACTANPSSSVALAATVTSYLQSGSGGAFLGGGQVGYNYQFHPSLVVGLEADIQGLASSSDSLSGGGLFLQPGSVILNSQTTTGSRSLDYLGTVRGRLGWLATPTLLFFASGGFAYGGANLSASITATTSVPAAGVYPSPYFASGSYSDTRVGWTAGAGVEWMFMPNWSAKLEYLYYDLGTATAPMGALALIGGPNSAAPGAIAASVFPALSSGFNGHVVRVGVNYHFNWTAPAPILAKY